MTRDRLNRLLISFLCAGSSALLLSFTHVRAENWWFSLFALAPFLWRAVEAGRAQAAICGFLLAISYGIVALPVETASSLTVQPSHFLCLSALFALYALVVNWVGRRVGFNAIFIAALWLPLEFVLSRYAGFGSISSFSTSDSSLVSRGASLFGLLMISFVVLVVNSLILMVVRYAVQAVLSGSTLFRENDTDVCLYHRETLLERPCYYFPDRRAPPVFMRIPVPRTVGSKQ
ncbi:MAG TPA: hypothetical protein VN285_08415 [Candidatus Deferrimicrobium sp.]|nr:hypothetical protein [Candidatus Deferrimicrobium sp.]